jgi:NADH-quinone oxidoreductase subunit L
VTDTIQDIATLTFLGLLIPLLPLLGFVTNGLLGKYFPTSVTGWMASLAVLGAFVATVLLWWQLPAGGAFDIDLFRWFAFGQREIAFSLAIDSLTLVMLLVVTGIGFLIHVYSIGYMHHDEGVTRFFTYLNLFIVFMLLLVMGGNYLVMFIGWEGVGLCSYLLIGFWHKTPAYNDAAQKAFVMNRIGDLGFLLGMFLMLFHFGTLDIQEIAAAAPALGAGHGLLIAITLLLFVGATGKSAQLPLYTWLPDAMAGPTPVSALIHAATMVTAGIYMVVRSNVLFALAPFTLQIILWIGVATSVFAAIIGLRQNDIKKVLAYSTVSQLGLMFAALGLGAFASGMFHVVTHAFFKALLFLGAGSVIHALHGEQDIRFMGGLRKKIPVTYVTFILASLAIAGFPLLSGFFSKDEILAHAFMHNKVVWAILFGSSLLTAFYMFRLVYLTFFNDFRGTAETAAGIHESPATMTAPLVILCVLSVLGGVLGLPAVFHLPHLLAEYLGPVTGASLAFMTMPHLLSHGAEIALMSLAGAAAIGMILFARHVYVTRRSLPVDEAQLAGWNKLVYHKFYVDELYDRLFTRPVFVASSWLARIFDKRIVDGVIVAGTRAVRLGGQALRPLQSGNTGHYIFAMVTGMILLLLIRLLL